MNFILTSKGEMDMLNRKWLRENSEVAKEKLATRGFDVSLIDDFLTSDENRRTLLQKVEEYKQKRNALSKKIGECKRKNEDATSLIKDVEAFNSWIKEFNDKLQEVEREADQLLAIIPNIPHDSVPIGKNEEDNVEVRRSGEIPTFSFEPKPHDEVGEQLGILDFARGAKVTGSRFVFYKGLGARLERALINFMLDIHTENGYTEFIPPQVVNSESLFATGQLPKFQEDLFQLTEKDYYLIPTAEVPITNYHRNEVLTNEELPKHYTSYSACFRSEAGSAGRDTKGIIRQHQFNKVELVKLTKPEDSYEELEKMTADAERILQLLNLPYRTVVLCTGDMGFGSAKTYDIEVWFPSQNKYREISSASNCEDFQAQRANIRFKRENDGKTEHVHTLNASGLAVGRTVAAILENYQNEDGTVTIPDVLIPYMGNKNSIK